MIPGDSDGKESSCNVKDPVWIPVLQRSLEEGMSTPSNILAWREKPGKLQSTGLHRVRHD